MRIETARPVKGRPQIYKGDEQVELGDFIEMTSVSTSN